MTTDPLEAFVEYAGRLKGDEKGEAQVFLERLFIAFGHAGYLEAGAVLEERVKGRLGGTRFADLVWQPRVLIEMKSRREPLAKHYQQMEEKLVKFASAIGVRLSELDDLVWRYMKNLNRHAIGLVESRQVGSAGK